MLHVQTARIDYGGPDRFDITRQTGTDGLVFAPSWGILGPALKAMKRARGLRLLGATDRAEALEVKVWTAYSVTYLVEMRASYRENRRAWDSLLDRDHVVLVCFCVNAERCHRTMLARDILPKLGAVYIGEITPAQRIF